MGLRCGTYGAYGDLCFCGDGTMGFVWVYGIAVWDLWGQWGHTVLRCVTYGIRMGLWGCGVWLMEHSAIIYIYIYIYICIYTHGVAMGCLWDAYGMPMGYLWDTYGILMGLQYGIYVGVSAK